MRIDNAFEVPAPPAATYELLVDLERVGPCIPGGEVGPRSADGSHPATITVKLGPMRMNYRGTVRLEEEDEASRRAVLVADVREQRGQGSARARMTMAVAAAGSGSQVETVTDVKLSGRAAQMGRGVVDDVAARLVDEMARCVADRLGTSPESGGEGAGPGASEADIAAGGAAVTSAGAAPPSAKPIGGLRLMGRVLWERLKRIFRRGGGETHA